MGWVLRRHGGRAYRWGTAEDYWSWGCNSESRGLGSGVGVG